MLDLGNGSSMEVVLCLIILWLLYPGYSVDILDVDLLHAEALQQSVRGDYSAAIENLKRVVELDPSSSLYWNDLGVTEMRHGQLSSAQYHFNKALLVNPDDAIAQVNLLEVTELLSQHSESDPQKFQQTHNLKCMRRRRMGDLLRLNKEEAMRVLEGPFVIPASKGAAKRIAARGAQFTFDNLRAAYGHVLVDYYPNSMYFSRVKPVFLSLNASLDELEAFRALPQAAHTRPGPYVQWNMDIHSFREVQTGSSIRIPPLLDDSLWLSMCFPGSDKEQSDFLLKTHWKMLLIGESRAGMFNHQDTLRAGSWQSPFMYEAGAVDAFHPDYDRFPLFKNASCFQEVLQPGEYIYYPIDYWHQTHNSRAPSIAISSSVLSLNNYREVFAELQEECAGRGVVFAPTGSTCFHLQNKCYAVWRDMYTVNNRDDARTAKAKLAAMHSSEL